MASKRSLQMRASARRDSSSSDEGEIRDDDDDLPVNNKPAPASAASKKKPSEMWTDVLMEQCLEEGVGYSMHMNMKNAVIRGAETYMLPEDYVPGGVYHRGKSGGKGKQQQPEKEKPIVTVSPAADEDLFNVVAPTEDELDGPWGNKRAKTAVDTTKEEGSREEMDMEGGEEITAGDGPSMGPDGRPPSRMGFRGRGGGRGRGQGILMARGTARGTAHPRPNNRKRKMPTPAALVDREYSVEALMSHEFPEGLSLEELGVSIAKALGEAEPEQVKRIVDAVGEKTALRLFEDTRSTEAAGGMTVKDGSRRRTPGGVFIMLFKLDPDIDVSIKDKIFEFNREKERQFRKAVRRQNAPPPTFADALSEVKSLLRTKPLEEAYVKKLSTVEEALMEKPEEDEGME